MSLRVYKSFTSRRLCHGLFRIVVYFSIWIFGLHGILFSINNPWLTAEPGSLCLGSSQVQAGYSILTALAPAIGLWVLLYVERTCNSFSSNLGYRAWKFFVFKLSLIFLVVAVLLIGLFFSSITELLQHRFAAHSIFFGDRNGFSITAILHGVLIFSYLCLGLTIITVLSKLLSHWPASLLFVFIGIDLFLVELSATIIFPKDQPVAKQAAVRWYFSRKLISADFGNYYHPNSTIKIYYPDNPRGYFHKESPDFWRLRTRKGAVAQLEFPDIDAAGRSFVRVITDDIGTGNIAGIYLHYLGYSSQCGYRYEFSFNARSDQPRHIKVAFIRDEKRAWDNLGLLEKYALNENWQHFSARFVAKSFSKKAKIVFFTGDSAATIALTAPQLSNITVGQPVVPQLPEQFLVEYKLNSQSCLGREYAIPKPDDVLRVVILGDSYAMGAGVNQEDRMSIRLEKQLNAAPSTASQFEVVNCSIAGYGTHQKLSFYRTRAAAYTPDLVLLVMVRDDAKASADFTESLQQVLEFDQQLHSNGVRLGVVIFNLFSPKQHPSVRSLINTMSDGLKDTRIPLLVLGESLLAEHTPQELVVYKKLSNQPNELAHEIAAKEIMKFLVKENLLVGKQADIRERLRKKTATDLRK